jgi:hypothetical protein
MRLCVRLGGLAVLLLGAALALVHARTEVACAGNRLHGLFREKRDLERECGRLELAVAALKSPKRLREHATAWEAGESGMLPGGPVGPAPP